MECDKLGLVIIQNLSYSVHTYMDYYPMYLFIWYIFTPTHLFNTYSTLPVYLIHIHPHPFIKFKEKVLPPRLLESCHPYLFIIFW